MNSDTVEGTAEGIEGEAKEAIGDATGNDDLKSEGLCHQMKGDAQKAYGKAREFAKENPAAVTALAGVLGLAIIGSIRKRT